MKIAVSACLLGENCKYNGGNNYSDKVIKFTKGAGDHRTADGPQAGAQRKAPGGAAEDCLTDWSPEASTCRGEQEV